MPSIYNYINYRDYLRDFFVEQKQFQKQLNHRAVLKKMGISSTGFLSNVIRGKKNFNEEMSKKLGKIINLATRERRYLNDMVAYTHAKSIEAKKKYLDRLLAMRKTGLAHISDDQFSIFSRWYYVYIRDLLCFFDFKGDYQALAGLLDPPIKPEEAEAAIRDLERLGFITKDNNGCYRPVDRLITTGDEVHSVQLANFQLATMDMAKRSLERHPAEKRDISFVSLTLSAESFSQVKSEVQAFRKRLLLMAKDERKPDRVYQCNIQLFPVTRQRGDGNA
ncbi:MAG: TIGR02147 family protein [Chitinispirillaceae bacterium]|nr:TIGR02147 family protein [Chitinispirillaceae bacterium]